MLKLLTELFGSDFIRRMIGTRTNVAKPIRMDYNSPYKLYSDDAFENPKSLAIIEEKIAEYAPYAMSNRNASEIANYEMNMRRLKNAKMKQAGVTEGMVKSVKEAKEPKPEADIIDIGTKKKVEGEGIMSLKDELGLPEGIDPKSERGKLIMELQRSTAGSKRAEDLATQAASEMLGSTGKDVVQEGRRRAVVRQMLLNDKRLKLSKKEMDDLSGMKDLDERTGAKDPLELLDKYYERDIDRLDMLDNIIDEADNAETAAKTFLESENSLKIKEKDLGEKLKKADDDPDMPEMAEGGRILSPEEYFKEKGKRNKSRDYEKMRQEYEEYLYRQKYGPRDEAAKGGLSNILGV